MYSASRNNFTVKRSTLTCPDGNQYRIIHFSSGRTCHSFSRQAKKHYFYGTCTGTHFFPDKVEEWLKAVSLEKGRSDRGLKTQITNLETPLENTMDYSDRYIRKLMSLGGNNEVDVLCYKHGGGRRIKLTRENVTYYFQGDVVGDYFIPHDFEQVVKAWFAPMGKIGRPPIATVVPIVAQMKTPAASVMGKLRQQFGGRSGKKRQTQNPRAPMGLSYFLTKVPHTKNESRSIWLRYRNDAGTIKAHYGIAETEAEAHDIAKNVVGHLKNNPSLLASIFVQKKKKAKAS